MMWFMTLLVLALAAFLIIRAYKAHSDRQNAHRDRLAESSGIAGHLSQDRQVAHPAEDAATPSGASANSSSTATPSPAPASVTSPDPVADDPAAVASSVAAGNAASQNGLQTANTLADIREMIKILNLAEPDAGRLAVSREQFIALRSGDASAAPDQKVVVDVAEKLRRMLA